MNITIVTSYYNPEITPITHLLKDLAEDLAKSGCKVNVVTPLPTRGVNEDVIAYYKKNPYEELDNGRICIHRIDIKGKEKKDFASRVLRYLKLTWKLYKKAKNISTDVYFIPSTPPTLGIIATRLRKKAPVIYNLQDMFPDSLINTGVSEKHPLVAMGRIMERYIYKHVDKIITISNDFKQTLIERGVKAERISLIYNWIDDQMVVPVNKEDNKLIKKYNLDPNKFYVTYCGNIGLSQNLEMVCDVAKSIEKQYKDIQIIIIGDGAHKKNIETYIEENIIGNVALLPFQPYEDISHVFSLGDIGVVASKAGVGTSSFPSKTWSIMSAARAVVASFDEKSELCTIINKEECGICVCPNNKEQFKQAIIELYLDMNKCKKMGENGRELITNRLNRSKCTKEYYNRLLDVKNGVA